MSATPSPVYEELIKESIPQLKSMILSDEYGRLRRHKIDYCSDEIVEDFIVRKQDLLRKERTLIIVNTVGRAQKIYLDLKRDLGGSRKIMLVHGDFAYKDRRERENQINNAEILVSTQVAEVSLDISFDLLITELSPIPSLVQRFGRVNRYGAEPDKTNVFICKPEDDKPYGFISMNLAYKNLPMLLEGLERVGEKAYLSDEFWRYEEIYKRDVEGMEQEIIDMIDNIMLDFFSFKIGEMDFSKMLGREETYLAVPDAYLEEVFNLREKLKRARDYRERKEIYTSIKEYLAPASRSDFNRMEFREELGLYVIKEYDREVGIKRF
jgi:CRISPR-associated endonuclease/helicase Cas3